MPRGGRRPGSGRKPKPRNEFGVILNHPSAAVPTTNGASPIEEFDAPDALAADERAIWLKQAPHAFANRTLTRATAMSFERYCRVVVLEAKECDSSGRGGPNHRGLLKQINAYELQFNLTPCGKPLAPVAGQAQPEASPSKLGRFRKASAG